MGKCFECIYCTDENCWLHDVDVYGEFGCKDCRKDTEGEK